MRSTAIKSTVIAAALAASAAQSFAQQPAKQPDQRDWPARYGAITAQKGKGRTASA